MNPISISVAPNGARKTKTLLPHIPISTEELVQEAINCAKAGASLFHLHIRDTNQRHLLDSKKYQETIAALKAAMGDQLVIQITTETVEIYSAPDMISTVKGVIPESASIGIRELIPTKDDEVPAQQFLEWAVAQNILIQYICYSPGDIEYLFQMQQKGVVPKRSVLFILYVLGKKTGQSADPQELAPFIETHLRLFSDIKLHWSVCAFGELELECMLETAKNGGHVRIGFENNHLLANGEFAPSNAALIEQFTRALIDNNIPRSVGSPTLWRDLHRETV